MKFILFLMYFSVVSSNLMCFDYIDYASQLTNKFGSFLEKDDFITAEATGGGFRGGVNKLSIHVRNKHCDNLEQARIYYVKSVIKFLNIINNDKKIRPYLRNYPATLNDIKLLVGYRTNNRYINNRPYIAMVTNIKSKNGIPFICYSKYDQQMDRFIDDEDYEETFEEAIRIVYGDSQCE